MQTAIELVWGGGSACGAAAAPPPKQKLLTLPLKKTSYTKRLQANIFVLVRLWLQIIGILLEGGSPAAGVRLWWGGTPIGTITDSSGRYSLPLPSRFPAWIRAETTGDSLLVEEAPDSLLVWDISPAVRIETQVIRAQQEGIQRLESQAVVVWGRSTLTAAPCCNLSEAFEGSALIDATVSDGALGIRQLRLLGFEPVHSPLLTENKPTTIGLYRLWSAQFLPALWIQSIALAKGIGSVLNGHEGPAGQVQVQYLSPDPPDFPRSVEAFARSTGEFFLAGRWETSPKPTLRYLLLANAGWTPFQSYALQDHNADRFLDIPLFRHGHGLVRRLWQDSTGAMSEIDIEALHDIRWGGEVAFRQIADIAALRAWGSYQRLSFGRVSLRRGWVFREGRGLSFLAQGSYFAQGLQAGFNRYTAMQPVGWMQTIYRLPLRDTRWLLSLGASARVAFNQETLSTWHGYDTTWRRWEGIPGGFAELTLYPSPTFSVVLGVRADWHSYWGWQGSPRFHGRWQYSERGSLRISAGRSWRLPDPIPEALPFLMSMRLWQMHFPAWPLLETAWSYGFFWYHAFPIASGILRLSVDGVRAHLKHPFLWDIERPWLVRIFSANMPSLYQTLYTESQYEIPDRLRLTIGYKLQEVWWHLQGSYLMRPLLPRHRIVAWLTWLTLPRKWQADAIFSWYGRQRLPSTISKDEAYRLPSMTSAYGILTIQLTHRIDQWEIQLAGENLNGFRQPRPVLAADRPFSPEFDASLIWGPVMGRMATLTIRYHW